MKKAKNLREQRIKSNIRRVVIASGLAITAVVVMLVLGRGAVKTQASTDAPVKLYKSISISSGDSLWSIAESYMDPEYYGDGRDYIDEVKSINGIGDLIYSGESIVIPYYTQG